MNHQFPIYQQIRNLILEKIDNKEYLPGDIIPSERAMASSFKVNRMTVKNAVNSLVEDGVLFRIQGKGTFVKKDNERVILGLPESGNKGISTRLMNANLMPSNKVLSNEIINSHPYLCGKLNLNRNDNVYALARVRCGDGQPLALEYAFIPAVYFDDFQTVNFENVSLYDYLDSKGHLPIDFKQYLIIIKAYDSVAKYLEVKPGDGIFCFEYIGRDRNGLIVEFTKSYMRPDKVQFNFHEKP